MFHSCTQDSNLSRVGLKLSESGPMSETSQAAVRAGVRDGGVAAAAQVLRPRGRLRPRQVHRARQQRLLRAALTQG